VGLNSESRGYIESVCPGGLLGLLSRTQGEVYDFFEKPAWDTYAFERVNKHFRYRTHSGTVFHANPYHQDHFINSYDPFQSYVSLAFCDYCEFSYHDAYTCPYRDYIDATNASVEKTINEMTDKILETIKQRITEYS